MNGEDSITKLIQQGRKGWLYLLGSWTAVVLFLSGHNLVIRLSMGGDIQIHKILAEQLFHYYFAFLCPLIYMVAYKYRINRKQRAIPVLVHILIILLMAAGLWLITLFVSRLPGTATTSIAESIRKHLKLSRMGYLTSASAVYYFVILSVMSIIRLNRQQRIQEKKTKELQLQASDLKNQLMQSKLQALRMQLHPHFFFNALNSISSLIHDKQNQLAYKTIAQLGTLIRTTLELPQIQTVPLSKEMEIIDLYLSIERLRFPDRLAIKKKIVKDCQNALVPSLILQPIVENCIRHAVSVEKKKIWISIKAEKKQSKLIIEISDNGPGVPEGWSFENSSGIGLKNVRERLKVLYSKDFILDIISKETSGLTIRIVIPFQLKNNKGV